MAALAAAASGAEAQAWGGANYKSTLGGSNAKGSGKAVLRAVVQGGASAREVTTQGLRERRYCHQCWHLTEELAMLDPMRQGACSGRGAKGSGTSAGEGGCCIGGGLMRARRAQMLGLTR